MSLPLCGAPRLLLRGWWHRPRLCCLLLWSETYSTKETFHDPAIPVTCAYCDHFQSALFKAQWFTCGHVIAFSPNKLIKKKIIDLSEGASCEDEDLRQLQRLTRMTFHFVVGDLQTEPQCVFLELPQVGNTPWLLFSASQTDTQTVNTLPFTCMGNRQTIDNLPFICMEDRQTVDNLPFTCMEDRQTVDNLPFTCMEVYP